jgi:hypothetical protein
VTVGVKVAHLFAHDTSNRACQGNPWCTSEEEEVEEDEEDRIYFSNCANLSE